MLHCNPEPKLRIFPWPLLDGLKFFIRRRSKEGSGDRGFLQKCPARSVSTRFRIWSAYYKAHGGQNITFVAISQDDKPNTASFLKQFGVTFPTLSRRSHGYAISNAYRLTNVPTWFPDRSGRRNRNLQRGWVKQDVEDLNRKLSDLQKTPPPQLFKPGEEVRDFRAGEAQKTDPAVCGSKSSVRRPDVFGKTQL